MKHFKIPNYENQIINEKYNIPQIRSQVNNGINSITLIHCIHPSKNPTLHTTTINIIT